MRSLQSIATDEEFCRQRARQEIKPYIFWDEREVEKVASFEFLPIIGDVTPGHWRPYGPTRWYVDQHPENDLLRPVGNTYNPVLTVDEFKVEIHKTLRSFPDTEIGWGIVEANGETLYIAGYVKLPDPNVGNTQPAA